MDSGIRFAGTVLAELAEAELAEAGLATLTTTTMAIRHANGRVHHTLSNEIRKGVGIVRGILTGLNRGASERYMSIASQFMQHNCNIHVIHESHSQHGISSPTDSHDVETDQFGQAEKVNLSSPKTFAVILAAGSGSRFEGGGHKLNAVIGGRPLYLWALQAAIDANIGPVIMVTGAVELPIGDLPIGDVPVSVVTNPLWQSGVASSLQVGLAVSRQQGAEAIVVGLGDQPFVRASAWRAVADSRSPIAVATYQSKRGNPVRLHAEMWSALPTLGDEGARSVFQIYSNLVEEVPCEGSSGDIDTLADLKRMNIEFGECQ